MAGLWPGLIVGVGGSALLPPSIFRLASHHPDNRCAGELHDFFPITLVIISVVHLLDHKIEGLMDERRRNETLLQILECAGRVATQLE